MTAGFGATLCFPTLFAAGLDWLEGLLPLLFLLFWVVSQVVNVIRKAAGAGEPKPVEPLRPPRVRPGVEEAPAGQPDEARRELERQIDEFLRRSRGEQPAVERPRPAATKPRPNVQPARPPKLDAMPRRGTRPAAASTAQRPLAGTDRESTDVGRHVHDAFAHDLRHLESPLAGHGPDITAAAARPPATATAELTAALRNPTTVRQLILLHEVLERPLDRW
jgi:hypothetical protein